MLERILAREIKRSIGETPATVVLGARQVGKTTLVKEMISSGDVDGEYLDLEFPDDRAKLQDPVLYFQSVGAKCIVLDEVQYAPDIFPVLRAYIDRNRKPGGFILLGSASPELLRNSSESLAGRVEYLQLFPLNMIEIKERTRWKVHFNRGGFPESFLAKTEDASYRWRSNFITTYLERDLPFLGLNVSPQTLRRLLLLLCNAQGSTLNTQQLAGALGVSRPTIVRYLEYFEQTFLITILEPYYHNIKKRVVKSPKYYIADPGIMHSLLGIKSYDALVQNPVVGFSWEGFVINQSRSVLFSDVQMWFFRTHEGAEADIVLTRNNKPVICAEIKLTNAPKLSKGFLNVIHYLNTDDNYIITPNADTYPVAEKVKVTDLRSWLDWLLSWQHPAMGTGKVG